MATPGRATFRLLGRVTVVDPTGSPVPIGGPRRRAVLAALLVHTGTSLTVDQLVAMLWPDPPPPSAATMVHGAVAAIRRALRAVAPHAIITRDGVWRGVGYSEGEASALHLSGEIALRTGRHGDARDAFHSGLVLCRRIGHRAGTAAALEGLAEVAAASDDADEAVALGAEAAALRAEIGVPRLVDG